MVRVPSQLLTGEAPEPEPEPGPGPEPCPTPEPCPAPEPCPEPEPCPACPEPELSDVLTDAQIKQVERELRVFLQRHRNDAKRLKQVEDLYEIFKQAKDEL